MIKGLLCACFFSCVNGIMENGIMEIMEINDNNGNNVNGNKWIENTSWAYRTMSLLSEVHCIINW